MTLTYNLDQLRKKTDRQLVQLLMNELDAGVCNAKRALQSADRWASAEDHYLRAKRLCTEASLLIPLADDQGGRGKVKLDLLRGMLEGLSVLGTAGPRAADGTPALARALWKARGCPEGSPEQDWFQAERALKSQPAFVAG